MRLPAILGSLLALAIAGQSWAAEPTFCGRLRNYETAPFPETLNPKGRRWVEFHWTGKWMSGEGWGWECRNSDDDASRAFCGWLVENTPYEFGHYLLFNILECHGYRFPKPRPQWSGWRSDIDFWGRDGLTLLEIDLHTPSETESGMFRLSVFDKRFDPTLAPLPDLQPLPPEAAAP